MRATKKCLWLLLVALLLFLPLASAEPQPSQFNPEEDDLLGVKPEAKNFSLLDPQRLSMRHSYTFSYFSNSRFSGSLGVYSTTLNYQLSKPLSLTLSLNYLHQPMSVFRRDNLEIKNEILPNFQLQYRPNSNFSLWINVVTFSSPYGWGNQNFWWQRER